MEWGKFYPAFRDCLYEKYDGLKNGTWRFLSHLYGNQVDILWRHVENINFKNGGYKRKQWLGLHKMILCLAKHTPKLSCAMHFICPKNIDAGAFLSQ